MPLRDLFPVGRAADAGAITGGADATERVDDLVVNGLVIDVQQPDTQALTELEGAADVP
ncbi:hypothetical protein D3C77_633240 [compost metagenome]